MNNFYFTFGSDPDFPFGRDEYVLVKAPNIGIAVGLFKAVHKNKPKYNCLNCAEVYNEAQWETAKRYYEGVEPIQTIEIRERG